MGAITAGMTAFYVFRAWFLAFFGDYRGHHHAHESPLVDDWPLMVLAVLSLGGGFINVPDWLSHAYPLAEHENVTAMVISAGFGIIGILLALLLVRAATRAGRVAARMLPGRFTAGLEQILRRRNLRRRHRRSRSKASRASCSGAAWMRR